MKRCLLLVLLFVLVPAGYLLSADVSLSDSSELTPISQDEAPDPSSVDLVRGLAKQDDVDSQYSFENIVDGEQTWIEAITTTPPLVSLGTFPDLSNAEEIKTTLWEIVSALDNENISVTVKYEVLKKDSS